MYHRFFLSGVKNIILNPAGAWQIIENRKNPVKTVRKAILIPLILIASLSAFAGSLLFRDTEMSTAYSIMTGIRTFIVLYFTVYLSAILMSEITYPLDLGKDFKISFSIMTFSFVPFILCQIFSSLFESLLFINVMALYGLYIFWEGAGKYLNPPQYKKLPLLIASTVSAAMIYLALNKFLGSLFDRIFFAFID